MNKLRFALFLVVVALTTPALGQDGSSTGRHPEAGGLLIRSYPPDVYGGGGQNWGLLQDRNGLIYVASTNALLEYDGVKWRKILTPSRQTIRSLAQDTSGRIWVGSVGDLGYLDTTSTGEKQFISLVDKLPADVRVFEDVWRTFATPEGVYFQTQIGLFRWSNGAMKVWKPKGRIFHRAQLANGTIYIAQGDGAFRMLKGDELVPVPGAERMADEPYPIVMALDASHLLMGTRSGGMFIYDGATMQPWHTDVDAWMKANNLYRGFWLSGDRLGLSSTASGMVILDKQGRLIEQINEQAGLLSPSVYYMTPDHDGGLWVATGVGLARVEADSPFSIFGKTEGLRASASDMRRHDGTLYIAHGQGVQYLKPRPGAVAQLVDVSGIANQCWELKEFIDPAGKVKPQLLVSASDGLFRVEGEKATPIVASQNRSFGAFTVLTSRINPNRVWVGLADGFASVRWNNGQWVNEGRVPGFSDQIRSLYQEKDGTLWLGTQSSGLIRLTNADVAGTDRPAQATITRYGEGEGLAKGFATVIPIQDRLFVSVLDKIVTRDASGKFVPDKTFEVVERDPDQSFINLVEAPDGRVFLSSGREAAVMTRKTDGTYAIDRQLFSRFRADRTGALFVEANGVMWFGSGGELIRMDTTKLRREPTKFASLVRNVTVNQSKVVNPGTEPRLPSESRFIRFEYAAPTFVNEALNLYQTRLDGVDTDWSAWSPDSRRDYTNLSFGTYKFHVHGRNESGDVGDEAVFAFTILPPWYRTWWANGLWLLAFVMLAGGAFRVQRGRVVAKERERSVVAEARLRAESAEQLAQAERERNRNIELLSEIGREITATLDFDTIFGKLYERVNQIADADVFGVGLYHADEQRIEYKLAIEKGKRYAPYSRSTADRDQLPVWCIEHREPVFINDVEKEYSKYITHLDQTRRPLEDGSMSQMARSMIYLPLIAKERVLGVVTIQSFEANAYSERHLNMMQSLAAFTAIALDNASAYRQLNEQEHQIRRLFEEAQKARATAEEADAAKSAFLSTVSHELRTPLTSVLGFAKIIKKRLDDRIFPIVPAGDKKIEQTVAQVQENLQVVVSEGERLTKLIDDVLDLAKIEAGKLEWHMEPVSLQDVIDHATAATASLFDQKGLAVEKQIAAGLPSITGDRDRLIQVVINLISNAVKFTDAGTVTCAARRNGDEIIVSVTDTGLGIAAADQAKVFERFKQVGDTLTDKPKGTGLGLPICKEIVEHHGGRIWVESAPSQGSTFSFSLPIGDGAQASLPLDLASVVRQLRDQVVVSTPRTAERKPRILVVDDEANIRALLTQEFAESGYEVVTASNGREAIAEVRRQRPDLVVLDVMMPEMNGFDVAAVLRGDPATLDIPIIILSIVQDRERGFRLGVDRYLTKPINTDLLFQEVGALLEQRKSHKRVLVVDEDQSAVKTLTDVLTARGYTVTEAKNHDLFEKAKALQPDIIMLSSTDPAPDVVQTLRFEKGLENVLFLVYR